MCYVANACHEFLNFFFFSFCCLFSFFFVFFGLAFLVLCGALLYRLFFFLSISLLIYIPQYTMVFATVSIQ